MKVHVEWAQRRYRQCQGECPSEFQKDMHIKGPSDEAINHLQEFCITIIIIIIIIIIIMRAETLHFVNKRSK